ncbi:hypothetical protein GCM10025864_13050 [Luteimicrobium album]|uniref:DUF222 domain-containing protein n=1 Tax=Luteimicrobium album TaxID=1054550 RepID=A0ABQ6HYG2_9MICO|nr:hypothetical protein [Luteimicrobium album]GMA23546.1 hypothetical protein GCM10025864_13050 [Luteimicrobium album]
MFESWRDDEGATGAPASDHARRASSDLDTTSVRADHEPHGSSSILDLALASLLTRALELREESWSHGIARPASGGDDPAASGGTPHEGTGSDPAHDRAGIDAAVLGKADALSRAALADLGDDALIDAVVGWQHVASWAAAAQARVVGELLARGGASAVALEAVTHELTAALVTSRHTAAKLAGRAAALSVTPEVADALADGRIDTARADALLSSETVPPLSVSRSQPTSSARPSGQDPRPG